VKTEDAPTRAFDDGLDVFLGKSGRRVEAGRTTVAPRGVHSVELENVRFITGRDASTCD
jgi:hypothetical protein